MTDNKKAFTLIELLVVVLIIGILAAIALPQYEKAVLKSKAVQGIIKLQTLTQAQKAFWMQNGVFSRDKDALGIENTAQSCTDSKGILVYCVVPATNKFHFEWHGYDSDARYVYKCLALNNDTLANKLCQQYQLEWGGTGGSNTQAFYTYYEGKWQK
jgi:type IV pilus assembly protein PilE